MKTNQANTDRNQSNDSHYALRRGAQYWALVFAGREASFKHELGALYVAYLLLDPPAVPLHAVALALKARDRAGKPAGPDEVHAEWSMGLEDAAAVRALWRRQRELERVLEDRQEIEPVKAESLRELEEVTEYLRTSPWRSRHGAERCAQAVSVAIRRFRTHLAGAVDAAGRPDVVLQAFAQHLYGHLLVASGRGCERAFTYTPPPGVGWEVQGLRGEGQSPKSKVQSLVGGVQGSRGEVQGPESKAHTAVPRSAAADYLARFLCAGFALALLASGCATRPLKGGRAVTTHKPAGGIEQTMVQGENASQATKQDQESVKVRSYTVPAGSRIEPSQAAGAVAAQAASGRHERSTLHSQPAPAFVLGAPMPVVEREETHARTELGAAQKDTARELGAKLASLRGIVWVGAGLFVFGLASLVWPPLKVVIGSVTTSAALTIGGLALMILPSLIVGNELLILGGVVVAVGGWFLAHRHGELRGVVAGGGKREAGSGKRET